MMIPVMDIVQGKVVQLVGASGAVIPLGDPEEMMPRYALTGEVAVIDTDAAMGSGENRALIEALVRRYPCRVGGGVRSVDEAIRLLDLGAEKVIIGTKADPAFLSALPRARTLVGIDVKAGRVVTDGGKTDTGLAALDRIAALRDHASGVVVTLFDTMGTKAGIDMAFVKSVIETAGKKCAVTMAGGISTPAEIAKIDTLGADVQVGSALHSGALDLADGIVAPIRTDRPDGLFATVVVDELGQAIGLVYSDMESIREAVKRKMGAYHSRSRGLWVKGLTSGNTQELLGVRLDCDRDALYFMVSQTGAGFCHNDTWSCWGDDKGIGRLSRLLNQSANADHRAAPVKPRLLKWAETLADATDAEAVIDAAAELMQAALTATAQRGIDFKAVETAMYKKSLNVSRETKE